MFFKLCTWPIVLIKHCDLQRPFISVKYRFCRVNTLSSNIYCYRKQHSVIFFTQIVWFKGKSMEYHSRPFDMIWPIILIARNIHGQQAFLEYKMAFVRNSNWLDDDNLKADLENTLCRILPEKKCQTLFDAIIRNTHGVWEL